VGEARLQFEGSQGDAMNIKPGNYSTHAYEHLNRIFSRIDFSDADARAMEDVLAGLAYGVRFIGPVNGTLGIGSSKTLEQIHEYVRLPYPMTCYEVLRTDPSRTAERPKDYSPEMEVDKVVLIGIEVMFDGRGKFIGKQYQGDFLYCVNGEEPDGFLFIAVDHSKYADRWMPATTALFHRYEYYSPQQNIFMPGMFATVDEETQSCIYNSHAEAYHSFCNFLALVNCKNMEISTIYPDKKLSASRVRKGKLPMYEYKVLDIHKDAIAAGESLSTFGDKNRFHMCRGHFKKLKTGVFWWNAHARGRKELGQIEKDYRLSTASGVRH